LRVKSILKTDQAYKYIFALMNKNFFCFISLYLFLLSWSCNCPAQNSISISTYYPSPSGVYSTLRLMPRAIPPDTGEPGELCYIDGTDLAYSKGLYSYIDDTDKWQPASFAGGKIKAEDVCIDDGSGGEICLSDVQKLSDAQMLVNSAHTVGDCKKAGGQVVDSDVGLPLCRFNFEKCPSGWNQYKYFSACESAFCASPEGYGGGSVTTPAKPWSGQRFNCTISGSTYTYDCPAIPFRFRYCGGGGTICCYASSYIYYAKIGGFSGKRIQIGCY